MVPATADEPAPGPVATFADRGVIEGYYGPPWREDDRLELLRWMLDHGMNLYIHAPKNDPYQRLRWRTPYPADELDQYAAEIAVAREGGMLWVPSISPALPLIETPQGTVEDEDICFSCPEDRQVLFDKLDSFWDRGARALMVSFDDTIKVSTHPEDALHYGVGDYAYGVANADLLNAVRERYSARDPEFRLLTVPVDYFGVTTTPYLEALKANLHEDVTVMWTGVGVVSPTISCEEADLYAAAIGRKPLLWDNFPVNDYAPDKLMVGPYAGRAADLPECLAGIVANPASQVRANRLPLYTVADYLLDPAGYQPEESYAASLREFGGAQVDLLERFVGQVRSTALDRTEAVRFTKLRDDFLTALGGPDWQSAYAALRHDLQADQAASQSLRAGFHDRGFVEEITSPPAPGSLAVPGQSTTGQGSWLARLAFNAGNGLMAAERAASTRASVEGSVTRGNVQGRVAPPADPATVAAGLEEVRALREADDDNPANVYGDRVFNALGPTYVAENRMDQFFERTAAELATYLPQASVASRELTLEIDGEPVEVAPDGSFAVPARGRSSVEAVVTDGVGRVTRARLVRPAAAAGGQPRSAGQDGSAAAPAPRALPATGGSGQLGGWAMVLLLGTAVAVRRHRAVVRSD